MRLVATAFVSIFFALASASVSASDHAQTAHDAEPDEQAAAAPAQAREEERLICRNEKTIGSNRATRVCRTASQIEEGRRQTHNALRGRSGTPRGLD